MCVCVCLGTNDIMYVRARSYIRILEAKIITCTCLLFLYFFPRNTARRCTVFILCFCTRLMCRDMRSYATRGDNRAGAAGRPRALRCPSPPPRFCKFYAPPLPRIISPRAGMTGPASVCVYVRACVFAAVSIYK